MLNFPFETLKVSWQSSIESLLSPQLTMLLLASLRALGSLYISLLYASFLPITLLVGLLLTSNSLICAFYITLLVRSARPSVEIKRQHYWHELVIADVVIFMGIFLLLYGIPFVFTHPYALAAYTLCLKLFLLGAHSWLPGSESLGILTVYLSPLVIIWVLFMLDARLSVWEYIKAFGRAVTMFIYNYPFFILVYEVLRMLLMACYLISKPFWQSFEYLPFIGWAGLLLVIIPFYVCLITNFYIKRIHEQFGLYYKY